MALVWLFPEWIKAKSVLHLNSFLRPFITDLAANEWLGWWKDLLAKPPISKVLLDTARVVMAVMSRCWHLLEGYGKISFSGYFLSLTNKSNDTTGARQLEFWRQFFGHLSIYGPIRINRISKAYFTLMLRLKVMRCHLMTGRHKKDATSLQKQSLQIFCSYEVDWNRCVVILFYRHGVENEGFQDLLETWCECFN